MYLHLGEETVVCEKDIIGIFDIENTSVGKHTKGFLNSSEKNGHIFNVSYEMPKSFIVCFDKNEKETVYPRELRSPYAKKEKRNDYPCSLSLLNRASSVHRH